MARTGIVGAGFGGLAMAIKALDAGHDVTVYEQSDEVGGTWSANTYPGAECDIPSALYSFSFEPYAEWPNKWSHQPVILDYLRHCADRYGVTSLIRFETTVTAAHWDGATWRVTSEHAGRTSSDEFDVVVSATGQLSRPRIPDIAGLDTFEGPRFHSARWDHDVVTAGKRIAVVGNAASATQFVPEITPDAAHVTVFQRSANWMIAKHDKDYSERWRALLRRFPLLGKVPRFWIWFRADALLFPLMKQRTRAAVARGEASTRRAPRCRRRRTTPQAADAGLSDGRRAGSSSPTRTTRRSPNTTTSNSRPHRSSGSRPMRW